MADPRVEAAIEHWAPRFIQNGVDYSDFVRTTAGIDAWEQWLEEWSHTADEHEAYALESEAASRGFGRRSAGTSASSCGRSTPSRPPRRRSAAARRCAKPTATSTPKRSGS